MMLIKGQLISSHQWLPWGLIGTNYPECGGHFLVKCLGRLRWLTLHQSLEVFSIKSSDYPEYRSSLGRIKKTLFFFLCFCLFISFSVSLNKTPSLPFLSSFLYISVMCLIMDVKTVDLLSPSLEKSSSHLCPPHFSVCLSLISASSSCPPFHLLIGLCLNSSFIYL